MRFSKVFSSALLIGTFSLSACTEQGSLTQPTAKAAKSDILVSPTASSGPRQITDAKELADIAALLKSNRENSPKDGAVIQGVGSASGSFTGVGTAGNTLNFGATVSGIDGSTLGIWEYSGSYSNGFGDMSTTEAMNGSCSRTADGLALAGNVKHIYMSLYAWDRSDPGTHNKFLAWNPINL
jgi:hypothetical protein